MSFPEYPLGFISNDDQVRNDQVLILGVTNFDKYVELSGRSNIPLEFSDAASRLTNEPVRENLALIRELLGSSFAHSIAAKTLGVAHGRAVSDAKWHKRVLEAYDVDPQVHMSNLDQLLRNRGKSQRTVENLSDTPEAILRINEGIVNISHLNALVSVGTVFDLERRIVPAAEAFDKKLWNPSAMRGKTFLEVIMDQLERHFSYPVNQRIIQVLARFNS